MSGTAHPRHIALPVGWVTTGRRLLIVGGGHDTNTRIRHALMFDWLDIHVILPVWSPEAEAAAQQDQRFTFRLGEPVRKDIRSAQMVIEDTANPELAARIAGWCREYQVPLNSVDKPWLCDVFYMSLIDRHPLMLAITSGGEAPALASALRRRLEPAVPQGWAMAAAILAEVRRRLPDGDARKALLKSLAGDPELLRSIEANDREAIQEIVDRAVCRM